MKETEKYNAVGRNKQNNWNVQRELARFEVEYKVKKRDEELKEHRRELFWAYTPFVIFTICLLAMAIVCITNWDTLGEPPIMFVVLGIAVIEVIGVIINTISMIYFIKNACQNPKFSKGKKVLWTLIILGLNWFAFPVYFHKHILYKNLEFEKENFRRILEGKEPLKVQEPIKAEERISIADVHSNIYDGYDKAYVSEQVKKYIDILVMCLKSFGSKKNLVILQEHGNTDAFKDVLLLDEFRVRLRNEMDAISRCNRNILDYMICLVHQMDEDIPGTKEIGALITLFETERELQIKKTLKHIRIMSLVSLFFSLLTGAPEAVMLLVIALPPTVASILFLLNKRPIWGVICTVFFFANRSDFSKGTLLSTVIIIAITIYFAYVTYLSFLDRKATRNQD